MNPADIMLPEKFQNRFGGKKSQRVVNLMHKGSSSNLEQIRRIAAEMKKNSGYYCGFKKAAGGWDECVEFIRNCHPDLKEYMQMISATMMTRALGHTWELSGAKRYLTRLKVQGGDFEIHRKKGFPWVFIFKNIHGHFKGARVYNVVLDFEQVITFWKSRKQKNLRDRCSTEADCKIECIDENIAYGPEDDYESLIQKLSKHHNCQVKHRHWLDAMLNDEDNNVSKYFDAEYKKRARAGRLMLDLKNRIRKQISFNGQTLSTKSIPQLQEIAENHNISLKVKKGENKLGVKGIVKRIEDELQKREKKKRKKAKRRGNNTNETVDQQQHDNATKPKTKKRKKRKKRKEKEKVKHSTNGNAKIHAIRNITHQHKQHIEQLAKDLAGVKELIQYVDQNGIIQEYTGLTTKYVTTTFTAIRDALQKKLSKNLYKKWIKQAHKKKDLVRLLALHWKTRQLQTNEDMPKVSENELEQEKDENIAPQEQVESEQIETEQKVDHAQNIETQKLQMTKEELERYGYILDIPSSRSWFDMDFSVFNNPLSRLLHACKCQSGSQIPGMCKHRGAMVIFMWAILNELAELEDYSQRKKYDESLLKKVCDAEDYREFEVKMGDKRLRLDICYVCNKERHDWYKLLCDACRCWFHPQCLGQDMDTIVRLKEVHNNWFCSYCTGQRCWWRRLHHVPGIDDDAEYEQQLLSDDDIYSSPGEVEEEERELDDEELEELRMNDFFYDSN